MVVARTALVDQEMTGFSLSLEYLVPSVTNATTLSNPIDLHLATEAASYDLKEE